MVIVAILVFYILSYRADPVSVFKQYSSYKYSAPIEGAYLGLWWWHKVSAGMWGCSIFIHLGILLTWGKIKHLHEILGMIIILSVIGTALPGIIMVSGWDNMRYDTFTRVFVIIAFVFNILILIVFIIFRIYNGKDLHFLGLTYRMQHQHAGFALLISPMAQVWQFVIYTFTIIDSHDSADYLSWKISMWFCMFVSMGIALMTHFVLFYHKKGGFLNI